MQSLDLQRFQAKPGESLPELLRKYSDKLRFRTNKKQAQIARDAWLDESYVSRLISGERAKPQPRRADLTRGVRPGASRSRTGRSTDGGGLQTAGSPGEHSIANRPEDWPNRPSPSWPCRKAPVGPGAFFIVRGAVGGGDESRRTRPTYCLIKLRRS